jgi:hypothetical protein
MTSPRKDDPQPEEPGQPGRDDDQPARPTGEQQAAINREDDPPA